MSIDHLMRLPWQYAYCTWEIEVQTVTIEKSVLNPHFLLERHLVMHFNDARIKAVRVIIHQAFDVHEMN